MKTQNPCSVFLSHEQIAFLRESLERRKGTPAGINPTVDAWLEDVNSDVETLLGIITPCAVVSILQPTKTQNTMKLENTMYEIRLQMWSKGGNFVRELSRAMGAADLENQARAVAAWPEIFERYDAFATVAKQQQPELMP